MAAHHEGMDGRGYYRGLRGSQIPLGARIIAVADRFDELTHDAPDHPAMELERTLDQMNHDVGNGLWPEAFQALVEELGGEARPPAKARHPQWPGGLTDRKVDVLRLIAKGLNRRQAARALFVAEGTVRSHLEHIYSKIGVSSRAAAALFAVEHDLLP